MTKFTLERTGQKDIRFNGTLLARVKNPPKLGYGYELAIYKTETGKFVCQIIDYSFLFGLGSSEVSVCEAEDAAIEVFENYPLARELFKQAGLNYVEDIE